MLKQMLHLTAAGAVGMMIGSQTATAEIFRKCDDERTQVSPACHPTFGYHQTCWRRFPLLPPCDSNCESCQHGTCLDGSCQTPIYQPQPVVPFAQPDPTFTPGIQSGRYQSNAATGPGPMPAGHPMTNSLEAFSSEPLHPTMSGHSAGSRYTQNPTSSPPMLPSPAAMQPANAAPPALPPVPGPAHPQSGRLFLPSPPSQTMPGMGRYGMTARRRATMAVSRSIQAPTPQRRQTTKPGHLYRSVSQRNDRLPNTRPAAPRVQATTTQLTRPVAAPLLKIPAN